MDKVQKCLNAYMNFSQSNMDKNHQQLFLILPYFQPQIKHIWYKQFGKKLAGNIQKDVENIVVPIHHSPSKKLSIDEIKAWNIPPCISNYKNQRGYTLPLHMRLAADMRSNKDIILSDKFSKFSDIINLTEKQFRKEIDERNKITCFKIS